MENNYINQNDSISSAITSYDNIIYNSRPASYNEYISDKYNKIHNELFNDALKKYYNSIINNYITTNFIFMFYKMLSNSNNNFEEFYNNVLNNENIMNIFSKLSIDSYSYCNIMFNKIDNYIKNIKSKIESEDVFYYKTPDDNIRLININDIDDFRIVYINNSTYLKAERDFDEDENNSIDWGEEFISYIFSNNEIIPHKFFMSELGDYVFLLETENGLRIGYNIYGELLLILDDVKYDSDIESQEKRKIIINYINNVNIEINNDFKIEALNIYKNNHRIIEIKNNEYWKPSSIIVISNIMPFSKQRIKLDKYWNNIQNMEEYNIEDLKISNEQIKDAEIIELNYVKGIAKMRSKSTDIEFEVPFNYLNENVEVNEELSSTNFIS